MTIADVQVDEKTLGEICQRFHVRKLAVFGSVAKHEARPDSDVDLLVEFEADKTPGFFKLGELADALSPLFGGREVDLVFPHLLHWYIRDEVLESAQTIYAR